MSNSNLKVQINWMIGYVNSPDIQVAGCDQLPVFKYLGYEIQRTGVLYVGFDEEGIFANFLLSPAGLSMGAIDRRITLLNGEVLDLIGCWSSRSSVVNMFLPEEDHIVECDLLGAYCRIAVRVSWLRDHLPEGVRLTKEVRDGGEIWYSVLPIKGSPIWNELLEKKPELCRVCRDGWIHRSWSKGRRVASRLLVSILRCF